MDSSKDIKRENNYILREIKQIGKRKINPENMQILENLADIHEIKDLKFKPNLQQMNIKKPNFKINLEVKLEGESAVEKNEQGDLNDEMNYGNEEVIIESEDNNNLIENIFDKLNNKNINDYNDIKQIINSLTEENKKEVIEGIKIKIDNEEQENRFNDLLRILNE